MAKKSQKKYSTPLTLHGLLGALSFWGTATRTFLFSFLGLVIMLVALSEAQNTTQADTEFMLFIYAIGSFLVLDFGYVLVARTYQLNKALDVLVVWVSDILLSLIYIVPNIVVEKRINSDLEPLTFLIFVPIVVLSGRMLMGLLFGRRTK